MSHTDFFVPAPFTKGRVLKASSKKELADTIDRNIQG
jgi:hypothetical protein